LRKRPFKIGIVLTIVLCLWSIDSSGNAQNHVFTVRDSIEMTRFLRGNPQIQFSPNNQYFAIVASRGIIRSDTVESTMLLFSCEDVHAFLRGGVGAKAPKPRIVARLRAIPELGDPSFEISYDPVIWDLQWLPNSKGILFLGMSSSGNHRRLYETDVASTMRALTPPSQDVTRFTYANGSIVYKVTSPSHYVATSINADAQDLTGAPALNLFTSVLPKTQKDDGAFQNTYSDLWVTRSGKFRKITNEHTTYPARVLTIDHVLVLSPDGRSVVVLLPVASIPPSWSEFEPDPAASYARIKPHDPQTTASSNLFRPTEYALIDTVTTKTTPLIQAPMGITLNSAHHSGAMWSSDGTKVLIMNTFLPLEGVDATERAQRRYPCLAAVVDVRSTMFDCVAFGSYDYATGKHGAKLLLDGTFGQNNDEVVLHMLDIPNGYVDENYRYVSGHWKFIKSVRSNSFLGTQQPFSVAVKQDLNMPPTLWVTDTKTRASKKLWDPNPPLAEMSLGEASVLRWRDASGYQWTAGLVKPPDYISGKRYPLVIQTHGFQADEFLSDGSFTTGFAARPLASAGMVVLQMPDDDEHLVTYQEISDHIRGFKSAIALLDAMGLIDPTRVGIIGFSRTCYYVESALIKEPHLFAAASIADGVDESYLQQMLLYFDGSPGEAEAENIYDAIPIGKGLTTWIKQAPGFNLYRVQAPLMVTAIGPLSILLEWEMYASLRMQKKPVDFVYIPDGQHVLQKPLERLASQQGNVDWFRFWLQGYEDSNPAKAAQYKRWEALRKLKQQE